jgi:presenilin-like A22 family membrane protease
MKHNIKVLLILVLLFLGAQYIGIYINQVYQTKELPLNIQRPEIRGTAASLSILPIIIFMTILILLLAKFKLRKIWKAWFFLAVWFALVISLAAFVDVKIAMVIALLGAVFKVIEVDIYVHNITELFIYGGLVAIFAPIFTPFSVLVLLFLISVYDMVAVWSTKHMIKLAKFQTSLKVFAGLLVPYGKNKAAILGGGDIGFPLLFTVVIYKSLGLSALVIPLFVALALFLLLVKGKKDRYYPAMPYLSAGCIAGYFIAYLL